MLYSDNSDKNTKLNKKMDDFKKSCHDAGLKVTAQRLAVYKALIETGEHPSAEALFRKVKQIFHTISLDTVNRTLRTLRKINIAFIVEGSGDAKRFDANLHPHQHFKCVRCKRIVDFYHQPFDNIEVPLSITEKWKVLRKTVYLEGICGSCSHKN
ncbi:MAG: transcriptional repressor [Planctomycetota bacterium]|nr:MAG: transcriptional repressor [Planctomycetota bacterium]